MVDYPHLSGGNSSSSPSRDLLAEFGILNPISSSNSEEISKAGVDGGSNPSSPKMAESNLCHVVAMAVSEGSETNSENDMPLGLTSAADVQDVFKAAHYFVQKDRLNAVEDRKKNMDLMEFLSAHGFSMKDVNEFVSSGKIVEKPNAGKVFVERPEPLPSLGCNNLWPNPVPQVSSNDNPAGPSMSLGVGLKAKDIPNRSWSSVVAQGDNKPKVLLEYFPPAPPSTPNGPIIVRPPREVLVEGNKLWKSCLVGGFLNNRLPFKLVEENAHRLWDKFGLQKVFLQDKGFFVFQFSCPEDRDNVLALGPWYILNKLLILKHWREGINFLSEACTAIPIWVKFHQVPMSYWSAKGLSFLASCIGKPILLDKASESLTPMAYAKVCIEVTPSSVMPEKIEVVILDEITDTELLSEVKVEYLNKPQLCPHCKTFGHPMIKCPRANYQWIPKASSTENVISPANPLAPSDAPVITKESGVPSNGVKVLAGLTLPVNSSQAGQSGQADDRDLTWTVVTKGAKPAASPPNSMTGFSSDAGFHMLPTEGSDPNVADSDRDSTPRPNPFLDKLKMIDEKEGRDLKNKERISSSSQKPRKKSKNKPGGGYRSPN